jgi:hypothetical protein
MDINTLAAWGEFIGGIAVVVSLVYLAGQIRQNSKLLRSSTASVSTAAQNEPSVLLVQDPEVARIYFEGVADRSSLSESDRRRFDSLITIQLAGFNQEFQFDKDGVIGPVVWDYRKRAYRWAFQQPGMQQWWSEWRGIYGVEFQGFVDGLIREGEAAG